MSEVEAVNEQAGKQEADRAILATMAAGEVPPAGAQVEQEQEQQGPPPEEALSAFLQVAATVAGVAGMRSAAAIWKPEVCDRVAVLTVPVLAKYGWGQRVLGFLQDGSGVEEVALGVYLLPLALATAKAAREDMTPPEPATPPEREINPAPVGDAPKPDNRASSEVVAWPA